MNIKLKNVNLNQDQILKVKSGLYKDKNVFLKLMNVKDRYREDRLLGTIIKNINNKFMVCKALFLIGYSVNDICFYSGVSLQTVKKYNSCSWNIFNVYPMIERYIS